MSNESRTADQRRREVEYDDNTIEEDSDLISHRKMSWGSLKDNYVPHEILSNSSISSFSSYYASSFPSWHSWMPGWADEEKKKFIMESKWGGYGLNPGLWDESQAPLVQIRISENMPFDELEGNGFVTDRKIGGASSFLSKSPECGLFVLHKCIMRDQLISDLRMLQFHRYLQYIDVSHNHISDLSPFGEIPYLMYLNVSHNQIKDVLNFTSPRYLTYVNLSHNCITKIEDVSNFWSIVRLDLSYNAIEVIQGLQKLKYLQNLNLSYNLIECIENLDNLNIRELNLEGNCITSFKSIFPDRGMSVLPELRVIMLGHNRLSSLAFFGDAYGLRIIDLKYNKISDLLEIAHLKGLLYEIDLRGNSCTQWPNYRDLVLFTIPTLTMLDGSEIVTIDKISAQLLLAPPLDLFAARAVTKLTLLEHLSSPCIDLHVKPYDELSPPMIILTGPSAVKKVALAQHVADTLSKKIGYCRWHTTKDPQDIEHEHNSYVFINREEFNNMTRRGEFLAVEESLGNSYGFHHDQISALIREKKIGITQMDLNATMQMCKRYPNVKPILVLTENEEIHRRWIQEKFDIFIWIKDSVEDLLAVKIGKHMRDTVSKSRFIDDILNEMLDEMRLPTNSESISSQDISSTPLDVGPSREIVSEETQSHYAFQRNSSNVLQAQNPKITFHERRETNGLRVILDEDSNIIVTDKATKRRRDKARILYRRGTLTSFSSDILLSEDYDPSFSSEDFFLGASHKVFGDSVRSEQLKNMYTDLVLKSRKTYLDHHKNKPGFFSLVLLTDNYTKAFNNLLDFIYSSYVSDSKRKPVFTPEMEYYTQTAIPNAIKISIKEIQESTSVPISQRKRFLRMQELNSWRNLNSSKVEEDIFKENSEFNISDSAST